MVTKTTKIKAKKKLLKEKDKKNIERKWNLLKIGKDKRKKFGEAGYRSQYLLHAKQALYHLSYIPMFKSSFQEQIMVKNQTER